MFYCDVVVKARFSNTTSLNISVTPSTETGIEKTGLSDQV